MIGIFHLTLMIFGEIVNAPQRQSNYNPPTSQISPFQSKPNAGFKNSYPNYNQERQNRGNNQARQNPDNNPEHPKAGVEWDNPAFKDFITTDPKSAKVVNELINNDIGTLKKKRTTIKDFPDPRVLSKNAEYAYAFWSSFRNYIEEKKNAYKEWYQEASNHFTKVVNHLITKRKQINDAIANFHKTKSPHIRLTHIQAIDDHVAAVEDLIEEFQETKDWLDAFENGLKTAL